MTDPVSDPAVCRQQLDVLEQQAKAADRGIWYPDGPPFEGEAWAFITDWFLALVGWIRQTLNGAEATLERHRQRLELRGPSWCEGDGLLWPCADHDRAAASIAGLAAVLAEQAVK